MTNSLDISVAGADGTVYTITSSLADAKIAIAPPPPDPEPIIPVTAKKVNIDANTTWKGVWDDTTPKTATGSSEVAAPSGRRFTVQYTNKAGFRFSCHAVPSGAQASRNFVYETTATFNWSQVSRWELDTNLVMDAKRVAMLCLQQEAGGSLGGGTWDLTFNEKWVKSNVKSPLSSWADGTTHIVRTYASLADDGTVTYIGVSVDGVYSKFTGNNIGPSAPSLSWSPIGMVIPNFQFEGSGSSGTIDGTATTNLYYW